jgi:flavin-dependent dehydrogenase
VAHSFEQGVSDWDLVIAGGGPVGLVVGIAARHLGLSALVIEQSPGLPDKACGEGMMPGAVSVLTRLGVDLGGAIELHGVRFSDESATATATFPEHGGRGLSRRALMERLDARARSLGVTILSAHTLRDFTYEHRVLHAEVTSTRSGRQVYRGRLLVAADGLRSRIRRRLGYELPARPLERFGLQRHYRCEPWSNWVEVYWHDQAEVYVTPVGPREVGVAVLTHGRPRSHDAIMTLFPELRARLATSTEIGRVRGAGPLEQRALGVLAPGVALVGDAAGYLDALSGEGLALGFRSAVALVERFAAGELWRYPRDHSRIGSAYYGMTQLMLALARRPRLRRAALRYLSSRPQLFSELLGIAAGSTVTPTCVLAATVQRFVTATPLFTREPC